MSNRGNVIMQENQREHIDDINSNESNDFEQYTNFQTPIPKN
jgi:hypothetical protein